MATVPGPLIWEVVKKNNSFLVKEFGNGSASVQFSKESNNLYNLNSYKHSGLANKKTVTIQPGGKDQSVFLATTKTKKQGKPASLLHKSVMKKEFRRMAKAVESQSYKDLRRTNFDSRVFLSHSKSKRAVKKTRRTNFDSWIFYLTANRRELSRRRISVQMAARTNSTESTVTMPTALVFLVSNFSNFVTIKLDSHNYMLWKNQVRNALSANGYLGFVDGTTVMPCPEILDSNQNRVSNPDYVKWMMINGHLLTCITATISPSIQTHLLGLEHVYEVWTTLSTRFSSLSRSHVHDLRQRLFNITKTGTMQEYLDTISDYAQKLAACGSSIDEEDLIFYALNGLPSEFDPIKSAARMRGGELKFEELTSILESEDMIIQKAQSKSSVSKLDGTTILFTTQSSGGQGAGSSVHGNAMPVQQSFSNVPHGGQSSTQSMQSQQPYYNSYQSNRNRGNGRGRGYKGSQGQQWFTGGPCQICFRTNHTAATCHYRQNLGYQPYQFQGSQISPSGQSQYQSRPIFQASPSQNFSAFGPPTQNFPIAYGSNTYQSSSQPIGQSSYHGYSQPGGVYPYSFSQPQRVPQVNFTQNMTPFGPAMNQQPGNSWYFDSGATSHVTNDLSNLSTQQPYTGGTGVMVGNGNTLPIAHSGSSYEPSSSQGSMSPGTLSNLSLY